MRYFGLVSRVLEAVNVSDAESRRRFTHRILGRVLALSDNLKEGTDGTAINLTGGATTQGRFEGHNHGFGWYGLRPGCIDDQEYADTGGYVIQRALDANGMDGEAELFGRHIPHTWYRFDTAGWMASHLTETGVNLGADVGYWRTSAAYSDDAFNNPGFPDPSLVWPFLAGPGDIEGEVVVRVRSLGTELTVVPCLDIHGDDEIIDTSGFGDNVTRDDGVTARTPDIVRWGRTARTIKLDEIEIPNNTDTVLTFTGVSCAPGAWNVHRFRFAEVVRNTQSQRGYRIISVYARATRTGT